MQLASTGLASASDVWFAGRLDPPADLDAVSTLSVRTGALVVLIPRGLLAGEGRPRPTLRLERETGDAVDAMPLTVIRDLPVASPRITFPHLQHGRYQIWLHRGDDLHVSPTVEVADHPATTDVGERSVLEELAERSRPE